MSEISELDSSETQRLLNESVPGTPQPLGYRNNYVTASTAGLEQSPSSTTTEDVSDLPAALRIIQAQNAELHQYKQNLDASQAENGALSERVDKLTSTLDEFIRTTTAQHEQKLKTMSHAMEAQKESQLATIDELKFQINSLRSKIDRRSVHSSTEMLFQPLGGGPNSSPCHNNSASASKSVDSSPQVMRSIKSLSLGSAQNEHLSEGGDPLSPSSKQNGLQDSAPCLLTRVTTVHRASVYWRINAFAKKLKKISSKQFDEPSRGEPFTTGTYGYRLNPWAYLNGRGKGEGKCLSLYLRVTAGEWDPILTWPIKPCYTFYLISQHPDPNKRLDLVRVRDLSLKQQGGINRPQKDDKTVIVGFDDFIKHEDIEKKHFLVDDSIFIKCVVEIPQTVW